MALAATATAAAAESTSDCNPLAGRVTSRVRRRVSGPPPRAMPEDLEPCYTRSGAIEASELYVDDTSNGEPTFYKFPRKDIERYLTSSRQLKDHPRKQLFGVSGAVAEALESVADEVRGANALVFGTVFPTYETLLLAYEAANVTTVEYNLLELKHPRLRTETVASFRARQGLNPDGSLPAEPVEAPRRVLYDVALSISSFDHDGLGRYGDPLCPDGDLLAMDEVRHHLRPGGLLLLALPVGPDAVVWNLHRRYGPVRLPLMLEGWDEVRRVHWNESRLTDRSVSVKKSYEPVFVLRNPGGAPVHHAAPSASAEDANDLVEDEVDPDL